MIKVETAQVKLIGFALATVLAHDQARHRLENLARPIHGARLQLRAGHQPLVGRCCIT